MKKYFLLIAIMVGTTIHASTGYLKSALAKEPQVIKITEDSGLTIFDFCHYKKSRKCIRLGREEGYTEEELMKLSREILKKSKVNKVLKPILEVLGFVAPIAVMATPIGPVGAMFVGSASVSFSAYAGASLSLSPEANKRLTKVLMPASTRFDQRMAFNVSIVEFSEYIEEKLTKMDRCKLVKFGMSRMRKQCSKYIPNYKFHTEDM
ncbi:MAG: hypothetical protein BM556_05365 [Bacteriovorax sp. MedPE-SWde]|nr:MAG: hypothetical protein BM556_05365 [Bacteriovorax sp. MedPE-SWde]